MEGDVRWRRCRRQVGLWAKYISPHPQSIGKRPTARGWWNHQFPPPSSPQPPPCRGPRHSAPSDTRSDTRPCSHCSPESPRPANKQTNEQTNKQITSITLITCVHRTIDRTSQHVTPAMTSYLGDRIQFPNDGRGRVFKGKPFRHAPRGPIVIPRERRRRDTVRVNVRRTGPHMSTRF